MSKELDTKEKEKPFLSLRPEALEEFSGQTKIKQRIKLMIESAKKRGDVLNHILLCGPPGLGKTTLSRIIAKTMDSEIHQTSGPQIEKSGDLVGVLTNLKKGDVLFIDEIHRLHSSIEEYLYSAMEDYTVDIMIDSGPSARSIQLNIPKFTLIAATTKIGMLTPPLRSRFDLINRLVHYSIEELNEIILRSSDLLGIEFNDDEAIDEVSKRSRNTPRTANTLVRWIRDYVQVHNNEEKISSETVKKAMKMFDIDEDGLNESDREILECIIHQFGGGPVGINSLALTLGEDPSSISDIHEPFLLLKKLIKRTSQGRVATDLAYQKLNIKISTKNQNSNLI